MYRLKVRLWKNVFNVNVNDKKPEVTILISDKIDFKTKSITKDKKGFKGVNTRRGYKVY